MFEPFDALTVPLRESNLIEASAGTGKTYSIAILALRLVLEARLSVRDILMVTFTKSAIAELQERIRLFIRKAYLVCDAPIDDANIRTLVERAVAARGYDEVKTALRDAVLLMDETSVLTIHAFCHKVLNEFAFETSKAFNVTLTTDTNPLREEALNAFWRKHVATLPSDFLKVMGVDKLKDQLSVAIKNHLAGKQYAGFDAGAVYTCIAGDFEAAGAGAQEASAAAEEMWKALVAYAAENEALWQSRCGKGHAKRYLLPLLSDPEALVRKAHESQHTGYVADACPELIERANACYEQKAVAESIIAEARFRLFCFAIQEVDAHIRRHKDRNALLTHDDLIGDLHRALHKDSSSALVAALRGKYKAVFVDEFQDTDKQQYEIFHSAFGGGESGTILFYIGDPKQSIYAFRSADVFTYFAAREAVQHRWSMNVNFRSGARLIHAMNRLFLPHAGFNTFHFEDAEAGIAYHPVAAPEGHDKGGCLRAGSPEVPVTVFTAELKPQIAPAMAAQVAMLLEGEQYHIGKEDEEVPVRPSDIGILVRTRDQAADMKAALAALGIPSVTVDDSKVLQSAEARSLLHFLQAAHQPNRNRIARALLSPFTGFSATDIGALDAEAALRLFNGYGERWTRDGVYAAIRAFITDFSVRQLMQSRGYVERALANLTQLTELLHSQAARRSLSRADLIAWLQRGMAGMATEGDAYEQRIESDEDAVNIVTIHKSKGLEYRIVLAPYLDFVNRDHDFITFRNPEDGQYYGIEKERRDEAQKNWQTEQDEQENRRLLYVTITRAVYKIYLMRCDGRHYKNSTLATFIQALKSAPEPSLIEFADTLPQLPDGYRYEPGGAGGEHQASAAPQRPVRFALHGDQWLRMSYTRLSAKGGKAHIPRALPGGEISDYDRFAFHDLTRGPKTGDLLHYIFERMAFDQPTRWEAVVDAALTRYVPGKADAWKPMLMQLINHAMQATLSFGGQTAPFSLSTITRQRRIAELEFDFPVSPFSVDALQALSGPEGAVRVKSFQEEGGKLEGLMNGKMDLFFEHGGRYYILDWKSNHLGYTPDCYSEAALSRAMEEDNYHLQYLIYTLAARRFLERRLEGFDYERHFGGVAYLFVRGVRAGSDSGIFTTRPTKLMIDALESILCGESKTDGPQRGRKIQQVLEESGR